MKITDPRTGAEVIVHNAEEYHAAIAATWKPCPHAQVEVRRFTNRNGSTAACAQCLVCGGRAGNPLGGVDHGTLPPADDGLEEAYRAGIKRLRDEAAIRAIDAESEHSEAWWAKYDAYLQTPVWRRRRELVLKRCDHVCEGCGEAEATEVHHMTYEHVFEEFLFELKGLCHACHERWHEGERR